MPADFFEKLDHTIIEIPIWRLRLRTFVQNFIDMSCIRVGQAHEL